MPSKEQQRRAQQYSIGQQAGREMAEMYRWYSTTVAGGGNLPNEPFTKFGPRLIRIARTTTNAEHPTYPSRPANTFVVEFGETSYPPFTGLMLLSFTAYDPAETRLAHDMNCTYHEKGKLVYVVLVHDQWFILGGVENILALATLSADLCGTATASVSNAQTLPDCTDFTPTSVTNPRKHRGEAGAGVLLVKKACLGGAGESLERCSQATEEWQIVDITLEPYCAVVGIEDRESCLVAAGLQLGGEWCPNDEPNAACPVVLYTDCDTQLPPCDTEWTFAPLYACCGQGGQDAPSGGGGGGGRGSPQGARAPGAVPGRFRN